MSPKILSWKFLAGKVYPLWGSKIIKKCFRNYIASRRTVLGRRLSVGVSASNLVTKLCALWAWVLSADLNFDNLKLYLREEHNSNILRLCSHIHDLLATILQPKKLTASTQWQGYIGEVEFLIFLMFHWFNFPKTKNL